MVYFIFPPFLFIILLSLSMSRPENNPFFFSKKKNSSPDYLAWPQPFCVTPHLFMSSHILVFNINNHCVGISW